MRSPGFQPLLAAVVSATAIRPSASVPASPLTTSMFRTRSMSPGVTAEAET